jgi:hypothetical protein
MNNHGLDCRRVTSNCQPLDCGGHHGFLARMGRDTCDVVQTDEAEAAIIVSDLMRRAQRSRRLTRKIRQGILIELMEGYLQDLEKKGLLPKGISQNAYHLWECESHGEDFGD